MYLAMYKGPADGLWNKLFHWAVCTFTRSKYSHCELVINGMCWSSSNRDGGVRGKRIDLTSGKWDLYPIQADERAAVEWFRFHKGAKYDWMGVLRFVLPFIPKQRKRWFCSEAIAAAIGLHTPECFTPESLLKAVR